MRASLGFALVILVASCGHAAPTPDTTPSAEPTPVEPGTVILLAAEATGSVDPAMMAVTQSIIEARLAALGLPDARVTVRDMRLRVKLPGVLDPAQAIATLTEQGLL